MNGLDLYPLMATKYVFLRRHFVAMLAATFMVLSGASLQAANVRKLSTADPQPAPFVLIGLAADEPSATNIMNSALAQCRRSSHMLVVLAYSGFSLDAAPLEKAASAVSCDVFSLKVAKEWMVSEPPRFALCRE